MVVIAFYTRSVPFLFQTPKGLSLVDSTENHPFSVSLNEFHIQWTDTKHIRNISMCVLLFPFSAGYASFSLLLPVLIRFLVYWLVTTFDWIVSVSYIRQPFQLLQPCSALCCKKEQGHWGSFRPPNHIWNPPCFNACPSRLQWQASHYCSRDTITTQNAVKGKRGERR